ncbi:MAG: hypothetical protein UZ11_BCD004000883 [Bacteroidetes bacterium OLB11]|nr:MAG: hypothetical protein UZ11_BCD004000883 [Bacteroidetes bacterium OLB11]
MKNFDLHTHVSLKVMLGGHSNNNRKDCWKEVRSKFIDALTGGAINSQSSFNQMQKGEVSVAIAILYSLEYAFTKKFFY